MSPAISTGYVKRPAETDSWPALFSLNCVIRRSSPMVATEESNHAVSECADTWLCTNTVERSRSSVVSRSSCGSYGTVIECRSTTQMNASPCSWVAAYWRKPPLKLPKCLAPVGWMPEKMRAIFRLKYRNYTQRNRGRERITRAPDRDGGRRDAGPDRARARAAARGGRGRACDARTGIDRDRRDRRAGAAGIAAAGGLSGG